MPLYVESITIIIPYSSFSSHKAPACMLWRLNMHDAGGLAQIVRRVYNPFKKLCCVRIGTDCQRFTL